jgi:hypothetical protein
MKRMIRIPISVAELFDKISILSIKAERISDEAKRKHILREFEELLDIVHVNGMTFFLTHSLYYELFLVNARLWVVCERRRQLLQTDSFGEEFIEDSCKEMSLNDARAEVKMAINELWDSDIVEVKSYVR